MKIKILEILVICVIVVFLGYMLFSAITTSSVPSHITLHEGRFVCVAYDHLVRDLYTYAFVDRETKVMYIFIEGSLSVLVDEDGNPLLYVGELPE